MRHCTARAPAGQGRSAKAKLFACAMISPTLPSFWKEVRWWRWLNGTFHSGASFVKSSASKIFSGRAAWPKSSGAANSSVSETPGGGHGRSCGIHSVRFFQGNRSSVFPSLKPGELKRTRIGLQFVHPRGVEVIVDRLARQAAHVVFHAVQFDARLRPHRADDGFAGHEIVVGDGRGIGREPDHPPHEAVVQHHLAPVRTRRDPGFEGGGIKQPVGLGRVRANSGQDD